MLRDISFEEAQRQINTLVSTLAVQKLQIEQLNGRVLAQDYVASRDLPASAQSAVDGYALGDVASPTISCYVVKGYLELGDSTNQVIVPGEAMGVMTGGLLPQGCVAVVPHERTKIQDGKLKVLENVKINQNIKQAGEDFTCGELLLRSGSCLDPGSIALMAAYGINRALVYQKPRVNVLALGRNVDNYLSNPPIGQTSNVNNPLLGVLIQRDGGVLGKSLLVSGKDASAIGTSLEQLLEDSDLLITSGGTYTRGDDYLLRAVEQSGAQIVFWGVDLMPGSHCGLAKRGNQFILLLSGNPTACFVGYHLFAASILHIMQGFSNDILMRKAVCLNGFNKKSGSRRFVRGRLCSSSRGWEVEVLPGQKPSMIRSMLGCNALIDVPAGNPGLKAGEEVSVIPLYRTAEVRSLLSDTKK